MNSSCCFCFNDNVRATRAAFIIIFILNSWKFRINIRLPKAIIAILRIEVEEGGTLRMVHRLILRIISVVDSSAVGGFLFDTRACGKE